MLLNKILLFSGATPSSSVSEGSVDNRVKSLVDRLFPLLTTKASPLSYNTLTKKGSGFIPAVAKSKGKRAAEDEIVVLVSKKVKAKQKGKAKANVKK
ncbi:uncharacterized protein RCO7_11502 [Rhynchosporium graminicola]|uniref:Uncharacterized protein n=1 Tax=Rhynchosporium graminicola TaxID=2792576 RepID=A0A1E1LPZ5_9HELO|nr:uncharacterized protein RCO7_11502 [Rhynchosporium commune]